MITLLFIIATLLIVFIGGIRIIRPTERGLIERLGKYNRLGMPGFNWIIPLIDRMIIVNITEKMVNAERQEIITDDNLNASVDAQVYFKIKPDEDSVKNSQYNVNDVDYQIVNLARTTLRNIIGTMSLKVANSERDTINKQLMVTLSKETKNWGIEVVRSELKEIDPPQDVQETMNKVVKAQNEKISAIDYATATETKADGERRARIKEAEGEKTAAVLRAEGQAKAFDLINKSFVGNAQLLRRLDVTEASLRDNAKILITDKGINPQIILGEIPVSDVRKRVKGVGGDSIILEAKK